MSRHVVAYEIAKSVAGSLGFEAHQLHAMRMHAGAFRNCKFPECAATRAILDRWSDAEAYVEDPEFDREFNSKTGNFDPR